MWGLHDVAESCKQFPNGPEEVELNAGHKEAASLLFIAVSLPLL